MSNTYEELLYKPEDMKCDYSESRSKNAKVLWRKKNYDFIE